jgi:hypothetical protein
VLNHHTLRNNSGDRRIQVNRSGLALCLFGTPNGVGTGKNSAKHLKAGIFDVAGETARVL